MTRCCDFNVHYKAIDVFDLFRESVAHMDRVEVCIQTHTVICTMSFSGTTCGKSLSMVIPNGVEEYNLCFVCNIITPIGSH